jgi:hypothetical protein
MSTDQVQEQYNNNTGKVFVPYSVDDTVVEASRGKIFTQEMITLLTSNPNKWYVVDEAYFTREERAEILSKRSVYYTAGKTVQKKFGNIDYKVKGGVENIKETMSNGFDYSREAHAVRLYARWTAE